MASAGPPRPVEVPPSGDDDDRNGNCAKWFRHFFCLSDRKEHMVYWLGVLFLLVKAVSLLLGSFCLIQFTLKAMVYHLQGFISR